MVKSIRLLWLALIILIGSRVMAQEQKPLYFPLPDSVAGGNIRLNGFALLPMAVPCISTDNGLYVFGLNGWLIPPHTMPVRSAIYEPSDSTLFFLSPRVRKTWLYRLSLGNGHLSVIDSLDGVFARVYPFSSKELILYGKEEGQYQLSLYNIKAGFMSPLYSSAIPINAALVFQGDRLLVASGGVVIELGKEGKPKQAIPIGLEIDGLATGPHGEIVVSTAKGVMSLDAQQKARLLIDKQHGLLQQYNNSLYVLDADNKQVIKKSW